MQVKVKREGEIIKGVEEEEAKEGVKKKQQVIDERLNYNYRCIKSAYVSLYAGQGEEGRRSKIK